MDTKNFLVYICAEDGTDTSSFEGLLRDAGLETKVTYFDTQTGFIRLKEEDKGGVCFGSDYSFELDNIVGCKAYVEFVPRDGKPLMLQAVQMSAKRLYWDIKVVTIGNFQNGQGHAAYFQRGVNRIEIGQSQKQRNEAIAEACENIGAYYLELKKKQDFDSEKG